MKNSLSFLNLTKSSFSRRATNQEVWRHFKTTIAGLTMESESISESDVWNLSEGMQVEEEEVVGEMDIGTKMYEPDAQEAENVAPKRPDTEWRWDPLGFEKW